MRARPLVMSGEMVRATLDGRKTQTRRVIKDMTDHYFHRWGDTCALFSAFKSGLRLTAVRCPYGQPGDLLYVREAWHAHKLDDNLLPAELSPSSPSRIWWHADESRDNADYIGKVRPSIHMPRWASRLTLTITGIRVERVQEISREDSIAEGIQRDTSAFMQGGWWDYGGARLANGDPANITTNPVRSFEGLWDEINGKRRPGKPDLSWKANPWVWVITFRPIAQNVDTVMGSDG